MPNQSLAPRSRAATSRSSPCPPVYPEEGSRREAVGCRPSRSRGSQVLDSGVPPHSCHRPTLHVERSSDLSAGTKAQLPVRRSRVPFAATVPFPCPRPFLSLQFSHFGAREHVCPGRTSIDSRNKSDEPRGPRRVRSVSLKKAFLRPEVFPNPNLSCVPGSTPREEAGTSNADPVSAPVDQLLGTVPPRPARWVQTRAVPDPPPQRSVHRHPLHRAKQFLGPVGAEHNPRKDQCFWLKLCFVQGNADSLQAQPHATHDASTARTEKTGQDLRLFLPWMTPDPGHTPGPWPPLPRPSTPQIRENASPLFRSPLRPVTSPTVSVLRAAHSRGLREAVPTPCGSPGENPKSRKLGLTVSVALPR